MYHLTSYPLKRDVEACNNHRLRTLTGPEHTYCAVDSAGYDVQCKPISAESANQLLDRMIAVPKITLKVQTLASAMLNTIIIYFLEIGAQVMLIQVRSVLSCWTHPKLTYSKEHRTRILSQWECRKDNGISDNSRSFGSPYFDRYAQVNPKRTAPTPKTFAIGILGL